MTGQNTEKQIIVMVLLLLLGVASLGAYTWFDNGRRAEARDLVLEENAERGAHLFARNCRVCHGNSGQGLIGPALNTPENTLPFRAENAGGLQQLQTSLHFTIACGRNGTPMPPWSIDQGGSLNDFKIDMLVALITTNAGDAWEHAHEFAIEEDEVLLQGLEDALAAAEAGGDEEAINDARKALEDAENRFEAGRPVSEPVLGTTMNTCGQES